jgi:predicted amidohydrolase
MIVDPLGNILHEHNEEEGISVTEIDISKCDEVRQQIPSVKNKRFDMYETIYKN